MTGLVPLTIDGAAAALRSATLEKSSLVARAASASAARPQFAVTMIRNSLYYCLDAIFNICAFIEIFLGKV